MFNYPVPRGRHALTEAGFAVIDLETTGFNAEGPDRIVEVAIVRIDSFGHELGTFQTLVDPGRSPGPSAVHGITREMLRRAPTFAEIAGSVLAWLRGVVVVAHNAQFEDAFLSSEFARAGLTVPSLPALDTLRVAQARLPTHNHKLTTVCKWAGVEIEGAHTAMPPRRLGCCRSSWRCNETAPDGATGFRSWRRGWARAICPGIRQAALPWE
jgi:ATP-dependent helicase Lhr and Lhr-like helicase